MPPERSPSTGDLGDEEWHDASRVTRWYETNPHDNSEPRVKNGEPSDLDRLEKVDRQFFVKLSYAPQR